VLLFAGRCAVHCCVGWFQIGGIPRPEGWRLWNFIHHVFALTPAARSPTRTPSKQETSISGIL
jgi:hypothetical protein